MAEYLDIEEIEKVNIDTKENIAQHKNYHKNKKA